ncbi:MAG TPA: hypothetical protein VLY45_06045 [Nitrospiria bacterium]|nr:hypothetical protein [Nitrospiria bacterium]
MNKRGLACAAGARLLVLNHELASMARRFPHIGLFLLGKLFGVPID